jgi:homoserine dehydrogenase
VYIVIKAQNEYVKNCFKDYGMVTDSSGSYSAIWRPYHYIGLELAQSIYSIVLDNKATGHTKNFNAEIASVAKKDLKAGQKLDGEGGYCARGRLISSKRSKQERILPMGYTDNVILKKDIKKDEFISLDDVELNLPKQIIEAREYQYNLI